MSNGRYALFNSFERLKKLNVIDKLKQIPWSKVWVALKFALTSFLRSVGHVLKDTVQLKIMRLVHRVVRWVMYLGDGYMVGSLGPIIKDFRGENCPLPPNMTNITTRLSGVLKSGSLYASEDSLSKFERS